MEYKDIYKEANTDIIDRYLLAINRILEMKEEETVSEPYRDYFRRTADFVLKIDYLIAKLEANELESLTLQELKALNRDLYYDLLTENYDTSYVNPQYAVECLGDGLGQLLSYVYFQMQEMVICAYEWRHLNITLYIELLIQIYVYFEEETPKADTIKEVISDFVFDNSDHNIEREVLEKYDENYCFLTDIVMNSDLNDVRYVYRYGEPISESELKMAQYMNSLSQQQIDEMADNFVKAYERGFINEKKDITLKDYVEIRFNIGFERMIRAAIAGFAQLGLKPLIYRAKFSTFTRVGFTGMLVNKQCFYDHRFDNAIYLSKAYIEQILAYQRSTYEKVKDKMKLYSGVVLVEIFGEKQFMPKTVKEAYKLSEKQEKLMVDFQNRRLQLIREYINKEETSFTIIAYPVVDISKDFESIFNETIKINTLDTERYEKIQQAIIDVLDTAEYVEIKGTNGNTTDLKVNLYSLTNSDKETKFENCLADVNVPLGEVFTSPVLKGTEGILNVKDIFLEDLQYKNLTITFKDGYVVDYCCDNFELEQENKDYIKENLLSSRETLPLGEFAIGTNTIAYNMAKTYGIIEIMPILIIEKMGPHFAVGDTCYSWSEDKRVFNPDGKEIVAKDNEKSILRKTSVKEAYTGCHTDITVPYNELGSITAVSSENERTLIIQDGRFVLEGTEYLNEALN